MVTSAGAGRCRRLDPVRSNESQADAIGCTGSLAPGRSSSSSCLQRRRGRRIDESEIRSSPSGDGDGRGHRISSPPGNSGSQAATLVIRAMALSELRIRHWWRVLRREVVSGVALGLVLCSIGVTRILIWQGISGSYGEHFARVALTVGTSLIGVVLFGTIAGGMLPLVLRACRLDPASASAPAVATLVDVSGLIIYFNVARLFMLRGTP